MLSRVASTTNNTVHVLPGPDICAGAPTKPKAAQPAAKPGNNKRQNNSVCSDEENAWSTDDSALSEEENADAADVSENELETYQRKQIPHGVIPNLINLLCDAAASIHPTTA